MKLIDEFEVSKYTMIILPEMMDGNQYSRVIETDGEYVVKMKPIEVVERSCRYFGSSFKGRKEGTWELMRITHKAPIVVDPSNVIYLFPTTSPTREQCVWISHAHVLNHESTEHDKTIITLSNKETIHLAMSEGSFGNQLYRTAQLRTLISQRIENQERKMEFFVSPKKPIKG